MRSPPGSDLPLTGLALAMVLALIGCQSTTATTSSPPATNDGAGRVHSVEEIFAGNPSVARMQQIGQDILLYYSLNKRLPAQLSDLQSVADPGENLNFISPISGKAYVYVPAGLWNAGSGKPIILYDPVPAGSGEYWCLRMPRPQEGKPVSVDVVAIPGNVFHQYQPSMQ